MTFGGGVTCLIVLGEGWRLLVLRETACVEGECSAD